MKLKIVLAVSSFMVGSMAYAAPNPAHFPGEFSGSNIMRDNNSLFNGQTITSITNQLQAGVTSAQTTANNAIPSSQKGVSNGVPTLDGNLNVTQNILSNYVISGPSINGITIPNFQSFTNSGSSIDGGFETSKIGGYNFTLAHSPYGNYSAVTGNLAITTGLTGPYNAGCGLCLFNDPRSNNLAPVSGEDYRTGYVATHDGVSFVEGTSNAKAKLVVPVSSYTATTVVLSDTLTAAEISQIHDGMYIITNSVPSGATQVPIGDASLNGKLPPFQNISGIIKSISSDGKTITVYGWGQENTTGTLTPSTSSLDTVYDPSRTSPVVYIGAINKAFSENDFSNYDGSVGGNSGVASSLVHQMEHLEIDQNVLNETRQYAVQYHGITIGSNSSRPDMLTKDSYEISLNGGQSQLIAMNPQWWTIPVNSDPLYVGALQGPALQTGAQAVLASFGQSTNTGNASFQSFHYVRPTIYNTRTASDGSGTDYQNIETDIGVGIDGNRGTVNAIQEHIALNPVNYHNGISLCGYATCGLSIDGNGVGWQPYDFHITAGNALWLESSAGDKSYFYSQTNPNGGYPTTHVVVPANSSGAGVFYVDGAFGTGGASTLASLNVVGTALFEAGATIPTGKSVQFSYNTVNSYLTSDNAGNLKIVQGASAVGGGFADAGYPLSSLPTTEPTDGTHVWCYDCKLNSVTGVEAYWHSTGSTWTDSQNNSLHN